MIRKTDTILDKIFTNKQEELEQIKRNMPLMDIKARLEEKRSEERNFKEVLLARSGGGDISIIAEIKKASPSAGLIREEFDPAQIARECTDGGAEALSVLTDKTYFQGSLSYLSEVKQASSLPVLRKDFIFDPYQIYEAKYYGADAILLIAAILDRHELEELLGFTHELGMRCLTEAHTEYELEKLLQTKAQIVGINARDLKTFKEDLSIVGRVADMVPADRILVAESSIKNRQDVDRVIHSGTAAILVGTSLMKAEDISEKIQELKGF